MNVKTESKNVTPWGSLVIPMEASETPEEPGSIPQNALEIWVYGIKSVARLK
jgi:hypothetical protein